MSCKVLLNSGLLVPTVATRSCATLLAKVVLSGPAQRKSELAGSSLSPSGSVLYQQPHGEYLRMKVVDVSLLTALLVSGIVGVVYFSLWALANPAAPWLLRILPVILGAIVIQVFSWQDPELFRSPFTLYENGFCPPCSRVSILSSRLPSFIPFSEILHVKIKPWDTNPDKVWKASIELRSGERLSIDDSDIGQSGMSALVKALEAAQERLLASPGQIRPPSYPYWIRREWRRDTLRTLAFTATLLTVLVGALPSPQSLQLLIMEGLLTLGTVWAVSLFLRTQRYYRKLSTQYHP